MGLENTATQRTQEKNNLLSSGYFLQKALPEREGEGIRHLRRGSKE
jgi:hypothetical protein